MDQNKHAPRVSVRPFRVGDASDLALICRKSVMNVASRYYSQAQVDAWHSILPAANVIRIRYSDGRNALVAVDIADRALAFGDVERNGHIQYFYCSPEAIGQGIGRLLLSRLEEAAACQGQERLFVEASESALAFFMSSGFEMISRRELRIGSIPIHNYELVRNFGAICHRGDGSYREKSTPSE